MTLLPVRTERCDASGAQAVFCRRAAVRWLSPDGECCHGQYNVFFRSAADKHIHLFVRDGEARYRGFGFHGQKRRKLTRFPALPDSDPLSFPCKNRKCVLKFLNRCSEKSKCRHKANVDEGENSYFYQDIRRVLNDSGLCGQAGAGPAGMGSGGLTIAL